METQLAVAEKLRFVPSVKVGLEGPSVAPASHLRWGRNEEESASLGGTARLGKC